MVTGSSARNFAADSMFVSRLLITVSTQTPSTSDSPAFCGVVLKQNPSPRKACRVSKVVAVLKAWNSCSPASLATPGQIDILAAQPNSGWLSFLCKAWMLSATNRRRVVSKRSSVTPSRAQENRRTARLTLLSTLSTDCNRSCPKKSRSTSRMPQPLMRLGNHSLMSARFAWSTSTRTTLFSGRHTVFGSLSELSTTVLESCAASSHPDERRARLRVTSITSVLL
mmetsp:Transcript_48249/g.127761  ORF Transcript_48249/g.127761 Transcript_48249/m.127761 type:complete len:225 (+) Transcript_48249:168-842(+)